MTLTDAGALGALVDKNQPQRARGRATFATLALPLSTTWPAFTEAMYLVYRVGGWPLQRQLWGYVEEGVLQLHYSREYSAVAMQTMHPVLPGQQENNHDRATTAL